MKEIITTTTLTIAITIIRTMVIAIVITNTDQNTANKERIVIHLDIMKESDPGRIVIGEQINTMDKIQVREKSILNLITNKEIYTIGMIIEMITDSKSIMNERIHTKSKVIIQMLIIIAVTTVMTTKKDNLKTIVIMIRKANTSNMIIDLCQNLVFLFHFCNQ